MIGHRPLLLVGAVFGVGIGIGVAGQRLLAPASADPAILRAAALEGEVGCTGANLIALEMIRATGPGDAASFLESHLSLNVVILDEWRGSLGPEYWPEIDRMLRKVAKYRNAQPFVSSEPAADEYIARILARTN